MEEAKPGTDKVGGLTYLGVWECRKLQLYKLMAWGEDED